MIKTPIIDLVFNRKKTATSTREASVELRITYNRKQKYMSTGIRLLPRHWLNGTARNRMDADIINDTLAQMVNDVRAVVHQMMKENSIDIQEIPARLKRKNAKSKTFIDYMQERVVVRKYGKAADSQERYERFMRFFVLWGGIVDYEDVNEKNIIRMDEYLAEKGMKNYSKWNNYHRFLNSFIIDAINEGLLQRNPYKHVRIEKDKSSGGLEKHLTPEEFYKIRDMELPTECLRRVRDVFVFQTYTCLSYVDLAAFDPKQLQERMGNKVYVGHRGKTGQEFTFLLLPHARRILEKYDNRLPIISNVKYNQYLKALAFQAGIDKPISSHWARHTGATMLLNEGIGLKIVAKILGHSTSKITEKIYAKLLDETVIDAMEKIADSPKLFPLRSSTSS